MAIEPVRLRELQSGERLESVMPDTQPVQVGPRATMLPLKYPQSVAVYDSYADAQKAVDYLSDEHFPVENLCIVGTDLKLVERVLGRRAWPQVLASGAMSGIGTGVFVGLIMKLLYSQLSFASALLTGLILGMAMGLLSASISYMSTRGQRDFSSISATVATRYEVLGEHKVVNQAREMLSKMPGARAAVFNPAAASGGNTAQASAPQPQQNYPQSAGVQSASMPQNWGPPSPAPGQQTYAQPPAASYGPPQQGYGEHSYSEYSSGAGQPVAQPYPTGVSPWQNQGDAANAPHQHLAGVENRGQESTPDERNQRSSGE